MAFAKKVKPSVKVAEIAATEDAKVIQRVAPITIEKNVSSIGELSLEVQNNLNELQIKINDKIATLNDVNRAIAIQNDRLKELHDIDAAAITLDELSNQKIELQNEIEESKRLRAAEVEAEDFEREKERERDTDAYEYNTKRARQEATDKFNAEIAAKRKTHDEFCASQVLSMTARESAIKAAEVEIAALKALRDAMPETIRKERSTAEAIAENRLKKDFGHQLEIATMAANSAKNVGESKIASIQQQLDAANVQIADLKQSVIKAREEASMIAKSALESVSGREKAEALSKVLADGQNGNGKQSR